jgi:hypothetical protein
MGDVLKVVGMRELLVACKTAERSSRIEVRRALKDAGDTVRADAAQRFDGYSTKTAAGFKVSVRQTAVSVRQSLRKTTGRRPDYGALQMTKGLLPARAAKQAAFEAEMEHALDRIDRAFI